MYTLQSAKITLEGYFSNLIGLACRVRQGCPLSPLLFDLVVEVWATAVRTCQDLQGIQALGMMHKITLYASYAFFPFGIQYGHIVHYSLHWMDLQMFGVIESTNQALPL